jgi:hypothetical protein
MVSGAQGRGIFILFRMGFVSTALSLLDSPLVQGWIGKHTKHHSLLPSALHVWLELLPISLGAYVFPLQQSSFVEAALNLPQQKGREPRFESDYDALR